MAPMIKKMEIVIREGVLYDMDLPSFIDGLHINICNWNRSYVDMKLLLKRINRLVNWVAKENHLLLEVSKH